MKSLPVSLRNGRAGWQGLISSELVFLQAALPW